LLSGFGAFPVSNASFPFLLSDIAANPESNISVSSQKVTIGVTSYSSGLISNCYLSFALAEDITLAPILFSMLRRALEMPLQLHLSGRQRYFDFPVKVLLTLRHGG